jgi:phosphocarrier protein HPr
MTVAEMPVMGKVVLTHSAGLHARPAVKLTKLAKTFKSTIDLATKPEGPWTDVKSVAKVMAMKVPKNSMLHFRASGDDADQAITALIALIDRDFDEAHENG